MNSSDHHLHDADSPSSPSLAPGAVAVPSRLQVARCVTRYASCTVDPRPGRAVHYPDLNACLVNEGRPEPVDCNAVHFGYAIPVSVVPLPEEPELAELVLDPTPDLTPEAVSYLLRHHPQLRQEADDGQVKQDLNGSNNNLKMAATAKHEPLRGRDGGKFVAEPEEDIAAIAKQISDHAEAIYQTWKSRGLAPAEILTCHSNATAADKFGSALTPQPSQSSVHQTKSSPSKSSLQTKSSPIKTPSKSSVPQSSQKTSPVTVDLLASAPSLDANNLEQLVNNFVVEDKARLAAARQQHKSSPSKPLPSSIQFALQKFEKQAPPEIQQPISKSPPTTSFVKPTGPHLEIKTQPLLTKPSTTGAYSTHITRNTTTSVSPSPSQLTTNIKSPGPILHHGTISLDTIETTFPPDLPQKTKRQIPENNPETTTVTPSVSSSSGLTTWPLKNKTVTISGGNDRRSAGTAIGSGSDVPINKKEDVASPSGKYATLPSNVSNNNNKDAVAYLDEVAREEERLINALKTGIIIAEDPTKVTSGTKITEKKSSSILQKKSPSKDKTSSVAKKSKKPQTEILTPKFSVTSSQARKATESSSTATPISSTLSTISTPSLSQSFASSPVSKSTETDSQKSQQPQQLTTTNGSLNTKDELDKSSLSNLSVVDYAKVRYRAAQQNPLTQQRLEDVKQFEQQQRSISGIATASSGGTVDGKHLAHNEVVPVARNRFQLSPRTSDGSTSPTSPGENWRPDWSAAGRVGADEEYPNARRRTGAATNLARPARHPPLDSHPPHQENAVQQRLRPGGTGSGTNPVRPFLTRGSVAERVLIFEKCPSELLLEKRSRGAPAITTWRSGHDVHAKAQTYSSRDSSKDSNQRSSHLPPNTTLQRHVKANRNVHIPRFYYPQGKPANEHIGDIVLQKISSAFQQFPNQQVPRDKFDTVTKACQCPIYWKIPLFIAAGGEKLGYVEANTFNDFWKKMLSSCHDKPSKFVYIMTKGTREFLVPEDFIPLVQDVVDTHPGLTFLKEATEFHSRYVHTVIARIYYCVNRSWSGRITLPELRRSNLIRVIQLLEEEEDINQVTAYFSYEHFYVIYCKFWELDRDHDLYIDKQDLTRHSDHALSSRMIDRIFSGAVTRGTRQHDDKMSYTEFVWFLLSEEDKTHPTAIEYWFRCMDLDGDGYLSMYELEYFYEEQLQRMEAIGIETLPFEDCLCQMLDMIHPTVPGKISLGDLKRCKMTPIFFDTFFNLEKYLDHEQRDPFASQRDHDTDGHELSDWDRYAAEEYELLVAEEGANEHQDEVMLEDEM
ncbi:uncharacterized protein [Periplaneta americana]|uniref:uncharacterized protein isoform X2 n=1 Tax=Periplaneta americana TaxID=6978 RepID=UPI0037E93A24